MIELKPLVPSDREQFILDNQEAFNYGALEEFGRRDDHFEEDGEIISRDTIEQSIDNGEAEVTLTFTICPISLVSLEANLMTILPSVCPVR